jgi:hypothetical protein
MRKLDIYQSAMAKERTGATAMLHEHIQSAKKLIDEQARNGQMLERLLNSNDAGLAMVTGDSPAFDAFVPAPKNASPVLTDS